MSPRRTASRRAGALSGPSGSPDHAECRRAFIVVTEKLMKSMPDKKTKKSLVVPFSDARRALIDDMAARTPIVKVPSRLRLTK